MSENPIVKERDARERAVRSFLWGLLIDASCTAGLALITMIGDLEWTVRYWQGLGLLLAKSFVQAGVAYIGRKVIEPYIKSRN